MTEDITSTSFMNESMATLNQNKAGDKVGIVSVP